MTQTITPEEAFEVLQVYVENALSTAQESDSEAMRSGKFDRVQEALDQAKTLDKLKKQLSKLQSDFNGLIEEAEEANKFARIKNGLKTPESEYQVPVLQAIVELGGSANLNDVLELVYDMMRNQLNDYDKSALPSDGMTPRWRNTAQWARNTLRQQGLLKNDSPRGIWEISDAGYEWLKDNT